MKNKTSVVIALALASAAYFYYKKIGGTIEQATQAATNSFWSLFQEPDVQPTDFNIDRLYREILNANGQLKIKYRELIK